MLAQRAPPDASCAPPPPPGRGSAAASAVTLTPLGSDLLATRMALTLPPDAYITSGMTTSKRPSKLVAVRLRPTDQRRMRRIISRGKAASTSDALRYGLKVAAENGEPAA